MLSNYYCDGDLSFLGTFDLSYAPNLLFYSFIPTVIISLLLAIFIAVKDKFSLQGTLLLLLAASFSLWSFLEIILWITVPANLNYLGWQLLVLAQTLIPITTVYFVLVFTNNGKDINFFGKLILALIVLGISLLLPTSLNMNGFDVYACEAIVGPLTKVVHIISFAGTILLAIMLLLKIFSRRNQDLNDHARYSQKQQIIILLGTFLFLLIYSSGIFVGEETKTYVIGLVGPIGMIILLGTLSYMIVKYKTFNIKLLGAQALMVSLWFLVGSLLFVAISNTTRIVAGVTLVFTTIAGYFLIRSVKKEVRQREQIEELAGTLDKANERLKVLDKMKSEFVSIASHQLRSPLTAIRGYASMLAEGSYGKLPEKATEALENIVDSAKFMALSVEDYLNVSRIEAGNMKYELSDFNLKETAEKIVDEMRPTAMKKGLVMMFRSDVSGSGSIHADTGKTRQVIMNLLDNSMKYTPKGTITVVAHDDVKAKKMYVTIQDTGVGMSKETQSEVFDKFVRAKNANSINVTGTGLGLFVAKKMVTEMGGKVWAESEGEGMGSKFHIEFPMVAGKVSSKV